MRLLVCVSVLFYFFPILTAQLSGYWSSKEVSEIQAKCQQILKSSKSSKEIYFALQFLGASNPNEDLCNCEWINKLGQTETSYVLRSSELCKCNFQPNRDALHAISSSLQSNTLPSLAEGLAAAHYLPSQFTSREKSEAWNRLGQLITNEDNVVTLAGAQYSAFVHQILELLHLYKDFTLDSEVSEDPHLIQTITQDIVTNFADFLPTNNEDHFSDGSVLVLLRHLSEKKLRLTPSTIIGASEQLVSLKDSADLSKVSYAYQSAKYLVKNYAKQQGYYLSTTPTVFSLNTAKLPKIDIELYDLLGNKKDYENLDISHIKGIGKDLNFAQGVSLAPNQALDFSQLDLSDIKLLPGRYHLSLKVNVESGKSLPITTYLLLTESKVKIDQVQAAVSKDASSASLSSVSQNSFSATASADDADVLHISYSVIQGANNKKPHQSFLRLSSKDQSVYYLSSKQDSGNDLEYSNVVNFAEDLNKFDYISGTYQISILLGDVVYSTPVVYEVGEIELKFPPKPVQSYPLYAKSLLYVSDNTLEALPEIEHVMRPPAKRASPFMAIAFSVLTLLPFLLFIVRILSLQVNLTRLSGMSSVIYVLSIISILVLYVGYWFGWKGFAFYDTIYYICILVPLNLITGRSALQAVVDARQREQSSKVKKE